jgi:hypothetical protein
VRRGPGGISRLPGNPCDGRRASARDAGGSRTHFEPLCRRPPDRRASASVRRSVRRSGGMSSPGVEPGPRPSHGRVPSATLRGRCRMTRQCSPVPRPGIGPGLAVSKTAVRPPHSRGNKPVPLPGVEPGLRPSGGRVPSVTRQGRSRSRRPGSNRHEPAYKAGASPFGHVGGSRGARIRTLCAGFGGPLLSQEHAPEKGPGLSMPGRCG